MKHKEVAHPLGVPLPAIIDSLVTCPGCGATVLERTWRMELGGGWKELAVPQNPVCGETHRCKNKESGTFGL